MLDRERILAKVDELDGYLRELRQVVPDTFEAYRAIEKRRACERLLEIAIECVIDICALFVTGLRLGLPAGEDDLFEKLEGASVISSSMRQTLRSMRGFRNILVHEYGKVDDRIVYEKARGGAGDFEAFRGEILRALAEETGS